MNDKMLQISEEDLRKIGYQVVDMIAEHYTNLGNKSVTRNNDRAALGKIFNEPIPMQGTSADVVLQQLNEYVFKNIMHLDHKRFFAFVPSPSNYISVLADFLSSGFNVFAGTWLEASGPAEIELVTINWLRQLFGFRDGAGGLFVSGGSMANLTALAVARHAILNDEIKDAVVYFSDQTHSSITRGLRILGFKESQICKIPSDQDFRLSLENLKAAIDLDKAKGLIPFCVVANAGTTNTGAVDPLSELAAYCKENNIWLHVDGAFGAPAILSEEGRIKLSGINQASSMSMDPHKWMFQPYDIGFLLVHDQRLLKETFQILPEYLKDAESVENEVNFADYGIELTRSFRALKLWMSLKVFGLSAFQEAINHGIEMANFAENILNQSKNWQVMTPAQMGVITFRYLPEKYSSQKDIDQINREIVSQIIAGGFAMVATTILRERTVLRICPINPRTTKKDIQDTIEKLEEIGKLLSC